MAYPPKTSFIFFNQKVLFSESLLKKKLKTIFYLGIIAKTNRFKIRHSMKKVIGALCATFFAINASASGLVPVFDSQKDDLVYSVDLDSVKPSAQQVLGGAKGEEYINAIIKIDAYENSDLRKLDGVHFIAENWVMSCGDYSYYRLAFSAYGDNQNFLSSKRLGNDIPLKKEFISTESDDLLTMGTRNAVLAACHEFDSQKEIPWHFRSNRSSGK